jgi:predicted XRE-type DNA-binding protein
MLVRRKLFAMVLEIAERDGLDQHALASVIRTSRPRAYSLLRGRIELFNSETLIDILARLGVDVDITVTRRRPYMRWRIANPRPGWRPPPGFATDY